MRQAIKALAVLFLFLSVSCGGEKARPLEDLPYLKDDLISAWRGTYPVFQIPGTLTTAKMDLHNARVSLIMQTENYWFEVTYYSDTLEYAFVSQGFWNWFVEAPEVIVFEATQDRERKTRKRPGSQQDSTVVADSILSNEENFNGDGSKIIKTWYTSFEFIGQDSLHLINFNGDLVLPEITLGRN